MLTKEKLGKLFTSLARIFPGIPSYQDRESLREQDKAVRELLAKRLVRAAGNLSESVNSIISSSGIEKLGELDRKRRKLHRLADTLRFSSYGYTGLFEENKVDEERLAAAYEFDLKLDETVAAVEAAASRVKESAAEGLNPDASKALDDALNQLDEGLVARENLLKAQT